MTILSKKLVTLDILIFSKDRPLQLYALLQSMDDRLIGLGKSVYLIVNYSNKNTKVYYEELIKDFEKIIYGVVYETGKPFKEICLEIILSMPGTHLMVLMDDDLIIEKVPIQKILAMVANDRIGSLRLGISTFYNYTVGTKMLQPPLLELGGEGAGMISWLWRDGTFDWGYPWSLDGNIFERQFLVDRWHSLDFINPNTLEGQFALKNPELLQYHGVAFSKQALINLPFNRVQSSFENKSEGYTTQFFLNLWAENYRIDVNWYYKRNYNSPHSEEMLWLTLGNFDHR